MTIIVAPQEFNTNDLFVDLSTMVVDKFAVFEGRGNGRPLAG